MDTILWIAAGLLAMVALTGGFTKTFIPKEKLEHHEGAAWTRTVSPAFVKTLGALELLAAVGLILPAVVDVALAARSLFATIRPDPGWFTAEPANEVLTGKTEA